MKLIRIVKLARVPYDELHDGDPYFEYSEYGEWCSRTKGLEGVRLATLGPRLVAVRSKSPGSVTYNIEGVAWDDMVHILGPHDDFREISYKLAGTRFDEDEIETRYV